MNFAPFTGHIPTAAALPTIHQFAAKFGYEGGSTNTGVVHETRYQSSGSGGVQFTVAGAGEGVKFRQADGVVVVSSAQPGAVTLAGIAPLHTVNTGVKYQTISTSSTVNVGNVVSYGGFEPKAERERRECRDDELMAMVQQQGVVGGVGAGQQLVVVLAEPRHVKAEARAHSAHAHTAAHAPPAQAEFISIGDVSEGAWQSLGGVDYLLPLHQLLKHADKREEPPLLVPAALPPAPALSVITEGSEGSGSGEAPVSDAEPRAVSPAPPKRKKKKKSAKEKKPRPKPGEIRLTTALDGSTLYCCPECHMAYPERGLLEQHLVGHTMERRFICDICNAALKRKDHLTRHKQSHNPERPHVCSVCLKAFKRKEQLTLHFVIHSGEKRHVCNECGKGFYRKDHLRKHTRSHIARRVKAELSAQAEPAC